jgi:O-methyltransferase
MKSLFRYIYRSISQFLASRHFHIVKSLPYLKRPTAIELNRLDYVRLSCLELAANEIELHNIPGSVAELGVYRGDFAADINKVFKTRKLYLFDTFEGFDDRNKKAEVESSFSSADQDFSDTSADYVLSKIPYKANCEIRKGFFPETAKGLNDTFAFVSIDTDLYEPIYDGLNFFYPLLAKGGYIFVHDFSNDEYKGAREAVKRFCNEQGIGYVPIADIGGTAIITK